LQAPRALPFGGACASSLWREQWAAFISQGAQRCNRQASLVTIDQRAKREEIMYGWFAEGIRICGNFTPWLRADHDLMADAATAGISRSQGWP
jgi:hypothetical protein